MSLYPQRPIPPPRSFEWYVMLTMLGIWCVCAISMGCVIAYRVGSWLYEILP